MSAIAGDLAKTLSHDPSEEWPDKIEIVAYWARNGGRGRRRKIQINADQFFGRGQFGAPMSGEQLIGIIEQLRKGKGTWYARKPTSKTK